MYDNASGDWALSTTISKRVSQPTSLGISSDGFLYVANHDALEVSLYRLSEGGAWSGGLTVVHPQLLALDSQDNVAVTSDDNTRVTVFPYGRSHTPYVIYGSDGIYDPHALAFDDTGNLYVGNYNSDKSTVTEYPPGSSTPIYTITDGVFDPTGLAIGGAGKLYVGNSYGYNVTVYAADTRNLEYTIPVRKERPQALLIDGRHLYIAAYGYDTNALIDYDIPKGTSTRITDGVYHPTAITKCSSTYICLLNGGSSVTVYQDDKLVKTIKFPDKMGISIAST